MRRAHVAKFSLVKGELVIRIPIRALLLGGAGIGLSVPDMTPTQRRVLELVKEGKCNKEIAVAMNCSYSNAKQHVFNLCGKWGVSSRDRLVTMASEAAA